MKRQIILSVAIYCVLPVVYSGILYDAIDLGTLPGKNESRAYSVNNNGQVVGYSMHGWRAVLFDSTGSGSNIDLGVIASGNDPGYDSIAYAVNNLGQIVGESDTGPYDVATLFDPSGNGINTNLGHLGSTSGHDRGVARAINDLGQIAGYAANSSGDFRAALFDPSGGGSNLDLGTLGGDTSHAMDINTNNCIVGYARTSSSNNRATIFDPTGGDSNTNLGTLGGEISYAFAVNESGVIVGAADWTNTISMAHAVIFDPGGNGNNNDLGVLAGGDYSAAYSINNHGKIVGVAKDSSGTRYATLFDSTGGGTNINLNTLVDPAFHLDLRSAQDINDDGWIVGYGVNSEGYERAFLLIPRPDLDEDGIDDDWEVEHFGSVENCQSTDDPDGDRYSNLEEFDNLTNPKLFDIGPVMHWQAIEIGWKSVSGTNYQIQATTNLASNDWQNIGAPITGNGTTNTVIFSTRDAGAEYFRVILDQ